MIIFLYTFGVIFVGIMMILSKENRRKHKKTETADNHFIKQQKITTQNNYLTRGLLKTDF